MHRLLAPLALLASPVAAQDAPASPVPAEFGPVAAVEGATPLPADVRFKVAFDTAQRTDGELNRTMVSAARFLNMHAAAGVPVDRQQLAVVVHGLAVRDVTTEAAGPNAPLVAALIAAGARVIVCGQSAASLNVAKSDLLPGVELALSAMTAHALLQQDGYTLNPF